MTSTAEATDSQVDALDALPPLVDEGLPLLLFERNLAPIRRIAAFATEHPSEARYIEVNTKRWLTPLLAADIPDFIRDTLISLAGQLAGVDTLEVEARQERMREVRAEIARLDAILGLPLPHADRPRPTRKRRSGRRPSPDGKAKEPSAQAPRERRSRRNRGRGKPAVSDVGAETPLGSSSRESSRASSLRNPFWNGNPFLELAGLDVPSEVVEALAEAGIHTINDLLHRAPVGEEIVRPIHGAGRSLEPGRVAVGGRFVGGHTRISADGARVVQGTLVGAGRLPLRWSDPATGALFLEDTPLGERVVVVGDWTGEVLLDPECVIEDGKVVRQVRYGIEGVQDSALQQLIFKLMPGFSTLRDPLPDGARPPGLMAHNHALLALHAKGDLTAAHRRLAYEEALGISLVACWPSNGPRRKGIQHTLLHEAPSILLSNLDTQLSDQAELAFDDVRRDLRRSRPMNRVLAGPPGGGKSLIALLATASVAESKVQVLWVTSSPQLAEAQYMFSEPLLAYAGIRSAYLRPGVKPSSQLRDQLKRGDIQVLFVNGGTRLMDLDFRRLGLVVSIEKKGEESGLGAVSKTLAKLASPSPDLLVVAATSPTAADLFGPWADYAVSWVDGPDTPSHTVKTVSQRDAAYAAARHTLLGGGQVAVLFPQIHGTDALDPIEASRVMNAINAQALPGARMALLHGAMPTSDRVQALEDVSHRRTDAIVTTLPLEDLAPLPGIDVIVIEQAQRMDLRRLERIAGMGASQVCLVVADDTPDSAIQQLIDALKRPVIASDVANMFFFDAGRDIDLLVAARASALGLLSADASLRNGANADLVRLVRGRWRAWFGQEVSCPLPDVGDAGTHKRRRRRRRRR